MGTARKAEGHTRREPSLPPNGQLPSKGVSRVPVATIWWDHARAAPEMTGYVVFEGLKHTYLGRPSTGASGG